MTWQQKLLRWYRKHKRDLPWRRTKDPYAIWVSEIMLQQTTVGTVIPYYERFLKKFPNVTILASALEEDVLRSWAGLGYYSRARNLHKAAKILASPGETSKSVPSGHPKFPRDLELWLKLPGIGRYTAGAIASIAFDARAPILDGNVIRVLSRIFCLGEDPKSSAGQKIFWSKAEDILPEKNCGDFNQALMELGATICVPENPLCLLCPVASSCKALQEGRVDEFPKRKKKVAYEDVILSAAVIRGEGGKILMIQRPAKGLLKEFWEIPMVKGGVEDLLKEWPIAVSGRLRNVRHSVLNKRLLITPFLCRPTGKLDASTHRWITPSEMETLPTSSMNRKIRDVLLKG